MPPDVSVVISSRNRPEMLAECLATVAAMDTALAVEVAVVDQSEPARRLTEAAARRLFDGTGMTLVYVPSDEVGASRGRNRAIRAASADLIAVTDDDCRVAPDWVDRIHQAFRDDPELMMMCGQVRLAGQEWEGTIPAAVHTGQRKRPFTRWLDPSALGSGNNAAYRREALRRVGGYDERLGPGTPLHAGEDTELFYRFARQGLKGMYLPEAIIHHVAWRNPDELTDLGWSYACGSGAYLTRELLARKDPVAAKLLLRRLVRFGFWPWFGSLLLGKTWHRRAAWQRVRGCLHGMLAVLLLDTRRGVTRDWLLTPPGGCV